MSALPWLVVWGGWVGAGVILAAAIAGATSPSRALARLARRLRRETLGEWGPADAPRHWRDGQTVVVEGTIGCRDGIATAAESVVAVSTQMQPSVGRTRHVDRRAKTIWVTTDDGHHFELADAVRVEGGSRIAFATCTADGTTDLLGATYDRYDRTVLANRRVVLRGVAHLVADDVGENGEQSLWRVERTPGTGGIGVIDRGRIHALTSMTAKASRLVIASGLAALMMMAAGHEALRAPSEPTSALGTTHRRAAIALICPWSRDEALRRLAGRTRGASAAVVARVQPNHNHVASSGTSPGAPLPGPR